MKTEELNYELPEELIATEPAKPRDAARLMVVERATGKAKDAIFKDLATFLKKGDLLIFNETKVFPARVLAQKETGGKLEVLFLHPTSDFEWQGLIGGSVKVGQKIIIGPHFSGEVLEKRGGEAVLKLNLSKKDVYKYLKKNGSMPLPPYLNRAAKKSDKDYYQTVFARHTGSAAAPTASLHFTNSLLKKIQKSGVSNAFLTLHVGLGTFAPVKTVKLEDHPIHAESFEISQKLLHAIQKTKASGGRVIAVGTTVARALETFGTKSQTSGETDLFIFPGYKFKIIDGLITNFHTPRSSLLGLVFAFLGAEKTKKVYQDAIKKKYRFFSYGDGMIIL